MTTKRTALCYLGMVLALLALLLWLAPPAVKAELNLYRAGNAITLGQVTHLDCRDGGFGFKFTLRDAAYLGAGSDGVAKSCDSLRPGDPVFVNFLPGHPALHWVGKLSSDLVRYALLAGSVSLLLPALVLGAIRWRARAIAARS